MRPEAFESVDVIGGLDVLPIYSKQGSARAPGIMHLALVSALAAIIITPQIGLAAYALGTPDIRQTIFDQPLVSFQLAVAMAFWIGLFAWPLKGLFDRLTWRRGVEITGDSVNVADTRALGVSQWSAPLASYRGITHHIRSSLSGTRHELVLVHDNADRAVLLMTASHISQAEADRMARLLRLPQLPAAALYSRASGLRGEPSAAPSPLFGQAVRTLAA